MKKVVCLLVCILCFSFGFSLSFYAGPYVEYHPFLPELAEKEYLKDKESYLFGVEGSLETKYYVLDSDVIFTNLSKQYFCVENVIYNSFNIRISPVFSFYAGLGVRTALERVAEDTNKVFVTIGGILPREFIKAVRFRPEVLLQTLQARIGVRFYPTELFEFELNYELLPSRVGKNFVGSSLSTVLNSGMVSLAFKYRVAQK